MRKTKAGRVSLQEFRAEKVVIDYFHKNGISEYLYSSESVILYFKVNKYIIENALRFISDVNHKYMKTIKIINEIRSSVNNSFVKCFSDAGQQRINVLYTLIDYNEAGIITKIELFRKYLEDVEKQLALNGFYSSIPTLKSLQLPCIADIGIMIESDIKAFCDELKHLDDICGTVETLFIIHNKIEEQFENVQSDIDGAFVQLCAEDKIPILKIETWKQEWLSEIAESNKYFNMLVNEVLNGNISVKLYSSLVSEVLFIHWNNVRNYFMTEKIALHQQITLEGKDELVEYFEGEIKKQQIIYSLYSPLNKIINRDMIKKEKPLIVEWASNWLESRMIMFLSQEKIKKIINTEDFVESFKQLKGNILNNMLKNAVEYSKLKSQQSKEFNSLLYRMRNTVSEAKSNQEIINLKIVEAQQLL